MKNHPKDKPQPKKPSAKSPTELLEQWDAAHPHAGGLSRDRYEEGSNAETVRKHETPPSEEERASTPVKTPRADSRKAPGETPEIRDQSVWGNNNPDDDKEDGSQPGFRALEPDQQ